MIPLLLQQVRNTAPFLFDQVAPSPQREPHLLFLKNFEREFGGRQPDPYLYFKLCLAAHHATVATFVPTDVDIHIRFKLWRMRVPFGTVREMARLVENSLDWDFSSVSTRSVVCGSGGTLSGHHGEWFSTSVAAYGALRRRDPGLGEELRDRIFTEIERQTSFFIEIENSGNGLSLLRAATTLAHNFGDLDQVIDLWELPDEDPLRKHAYKLGHTPRGGALYRAGELNKAFMAVENHRHYALRKPRALRRSAQLLLPIAPFLDEWGECVATHPMLETHEIGEIVQSLVEGFERLNGPVGYARALVGIEENFPGGMSELCRNLPRKVAQRWKTGALRRQCSISRTRFEAGWERAALRFFDRQPREG